MWKDIKEILLDFLKGFRWYLLFIPALIFLFVFGRYNILVGFLPIFILLLFILFTPFILALGTILSFIFNTDERECSKHKRKKLKKK